MSSARSRPRAMPRISTYCNNSRAPARIAQRAPPPESVSTAAGVMTDRFAASFAAYLFSICCLVAGSSMDGLAFGAPSPCGLPPSPPSRAPCAASSDKTSVPSENDCSGKVASSQLLRSGGAADVLVASSSLMASARRASSSHRLPTTLSLRSPRASRISDCNIFLTLPPARREAGSRRSIAASRPHGSMSLRIACGSKWCRISARVSMSSSLHARCWRRPAKASDIAVSLAIGDILINIFLSNKVGTVPRVTDDGPRSTSWAAGSPSGVSDGAGDRAAWCL